MEGDLDSIEDGSKNWIEFLHEFYGPFKTTLSKAEGAMDKVKIADEESDVICDKCGRTMVYKLGRFGKFLACPGFPECRNTKAIVVETGVNCPKCGGMILEKKSQRGKKYYGCENSPKCDYISWDAPTKEKCPKCGSMMLEKRFGRGSRKYCPECNANDGSKK